MASGEGPTLRRRRLRAELRKAREAADLTQEQVAKEMDWSTAKVIRIEAGRTGISTNDLRALLALYGVTDQQRVTELVELARGSRQRGWWSAYKGVLRSQYTTYISFEAEAAMLRNFEPLMVPGLLQTEEYARAVVREAALRELRPDEVDARVTVRMARQQVLSRDDPPRLCAIVGEAALRQLVGGPEVMRRQLQRLVEAGEQPKVTIQVLPFSVGAHAGMHGPFMILEFAEHTDDDVVYLENAVGGLYLEEQAEVKRYRLVFEHLRGMALSPDDSAALIAKVAREIT